MRVRVPQGHEKHTIEEWLRWLKSQYQAANRTRNGLSAQRLFKAYRNPRPPHHYVQMATVMIEAGGKAPGLDFFHLYHAHSGESLWNGYECMGRHGGTAARVAKNIIRSRIARASHGKPTAEPLERTALRLP